MALIKRNQRELEQISPLPSLGIDPISGDLRFEIVIGAYIVSLTRREREKIMNAWKVLLEDVENGKRI